MLKIFIPTKKFLVAASLITIIFVGGYHLQLAGEEERTEKELLELTQEIDALSLEQAKIEDEKQDLFKTRDWTELDRTEQKLDETINCRTEQCLNEWKRLVEKRDTLMKKFYGIEEEQAKAVENIQPVIDTGKKYLGKWYITTYYTPLLDQKRTDRNIARDLKINCSGDCLVTASGYKLTHEDKFKVVACPPAFPFGTQFDIEGTGIVRCEDRGGAIKGQHLDLWVGIGDDAWIGKGSGMKDVYQL